MSKFAVFDIDGTLIRWQLFHAIVHSLGKYGHIPAEAHERIRAARMKWKRRDSGVDFSSYELVLVKEYLAAIRQVNAQEYAAIVQDVFDEYKDQTYTYTRDLIKKLKAQGYTLIAISGSHQDVVEKLAKHHGFDIVAGATFEQIDGKFSGNFNTPVFNKGKVLRSLIDEYHLDTRESYAVGDSSGDAQMLELVERPIAFNPDQKLFSLAVAHGWLVVVERKNMTYELEAKDGGYTLKIA